MIYDGNELHYIENSKNNTINDLHYLFKHSDLAESNKTCGYVGSSTSFHEPHHDVFENQNRILRVSWKHD